MRASRSVLVVASALVPVVAAACSPSALEARLDAPPVVISADDATQELRFTAAADVSARLAGGEVQVVVTPPALEDGEGQVRVTITKDAPRDVQPAEDVVPCAASRDVVVPREALATCGGECRERFVVVFAAEGLAPDARVELPVTVEAHVLYENAVEPPPGDSLVLTVEP